jgi:hypothetical protein
VPPPPHSTTYVSSYYCIYVCSTRSCARRTARRATTCCSSAALLIYIYIHIYAQPQAYRATCHHLLLLRLLLRRACNSCNRSCNSCNRACNSCNRACNSCNRGDTHTSTTCCSCAALTSKQARYRAPACWRCVCVYIYNICVSSYYKCII